MREPGLHRIVQCVLKNFIPSRRPIHTTTQRLFRIQASNVKPTSEDDDAGSVPHQSTKIQASILERSPDRRKLYKIIENLGSNSNLRQSYFPVERIRLAMDDLQQEDPPVRLALLASKDVSSLLRKVVVHRFYDVFLNETKEGVTVTRPPDSREPGIYPELLAMLGAVLPIDVDGRPLHVFLGDLRSPDGKLVDPLLPLGKVVQGAELGPWPVHRTFVIRKDSDDTKPNITLSNGRGWSPVEVIHDLPFEVFQKESLKNENNKRLRISTERALLARDIMAEEVDRGTHKQGYERPLEMWNQSGILDIPDMLREAAKREDQGTDQIPIHVRDSLAALLFKAPDTSEIPDFDEYVGTLEMEKRAWVHDLIAHGRVEIQRQVDGLQINKTDPNPFTILSQTGKMRAIIENNYLSASEVGFMELYRRLIKGELPVPSSGSAEPTSGSSPTPELPVFGNFRSWIFQLGESLSPHVRDRRREFFASCGWGAVATGLLIHYSIDPAIALSLFALIAAVSLRRFRSGVKSLWGSYEIQLATMGVEFLNDLEIYFMDNTKPNPKQDFTRYKMEKGELELVRREVTEARRLLVKLAPSLRSEFPEWEKPSS
ncbi:uncharacterized protein DFL_008411 [Arthrobotrys flagrans]|uniref:Uncharacterized protein n=1 Tax=Arthrobotrys flagrans TaxID=97331 RepID=A0A436ZNR7_ARTFL|nr:hypothetical protein DFL_008411 [Arthrobotrys flagrans]